MGQTYLCKNLGVKEGGGHLFEGGLLAGDYGNVANQLHTWPVNQAGQFINWSNNLRDRRFTSRLKSLHLAGEMAAQADWQCKVAKQARREVKAKSRMIVFYWESQSYNHVRKSFSCAHLGIPVQFNISYKMYLACFLTLRWQKFVPRKLSIAIYCIAWSFFSLQRAKTSNSQIHRVTEWMVCTWVVSKLTACIIR